MEVDQKVIDLISEKYPEWGLFLSLSGNKTAVLKGPLSPWKQEGIDVLYIYGLSDFYLPEIKKWLCSDSKRRCLIFEDSPERLEMFLLRPKALNLLNEPQVVIRFVSNETLWESAIERSLNEFPSARIEITSPANASKQKLALLRQILLERAAAFQALYSEALHYPALVKNLAINLRRLPEAFNGTALRDKFSGIPAVICGAGPSLEKEIETLKKLDEKALIFAGGSAIGALHRFGVEPHFCVAVDPNNEEEIRLKGVSASQVPLLYANRVYPPIFSKFKGPKGVLCSNTGGPFEKWIEEELGLSQEPIGSDLNQEAFSVTAIALATAVAFGCNPILITGVDLAYTGGKRYASGVDEGGDAVDLMGALDRRLRKKDKHGKWLETQVRWVMEAEVIGAYAKQKSRRKFVDCSSEGLELPGIEYKPLSTAIKIYGRKRRDLRGQIAKKIEKLHLDNLTSTQIEILFTKQGESLLRCQKLCKQCLKEKKTEKIFFFEFELEEELAYHTFLNTTGLLISHLFPQEPWAKWTWMEEAIEKILRHLDKH